MPNFFDRFSSAWSAASLPSVPLPKPPTGQQTEPAYRTVVGGTASLLRTTERGLLNNDRLGVRSAGTTKEAIRQLSYSSPDMSAAIFSMLRAGIPEKYTVVARNMDGQIDSETTGLAQELLRRLTYLGNVDGSYGAQMSIQSLSESLGRELITYGACSGEVALDKTRTPASLNAVSVTNVKWYDEDGAARPVQIVGGTEISLDIPTYIYVSLDQDLLDPFCSSPMEASMQPILTDLEFNNDVRRALKRAVLPRLVATIDSEAVRKSTPPDILADSSKFATYKQTLIESVQSVVNGANPEDALISFSEITYAYVDGGKDPSAIIERMQAVLNSKLQAGIKTLPIVIGHGSNATAGSAESLLFLKSANMLRVKLNEFYSRALTIAVRILGKDCYVEFTYANIDLRPDSELEAYKSMAQSRTLELLSLGLLTDEEACIQLTGNLPPAGFKPLSGTMFRSAKVDTSAQPGTAASGTSALGKEAPTSPKSPKAEVTESVVTKADNSDLLQAHSESLKAVQDLAYSMSRQAQKPVEVTVTPSELHLTLAAETVKPTRTIKVIRDAEGKFSGMEVSNDS